MNQGLICRVGDSGLENLDRDNILGYTGMTGRVDGRKRRGCDRLLLGELVLVQFADAGYSHRLTLARV